MDAQETKTLFLLSVRQTIEILGLEETASLFQKLIEYHNLEGE